MPADIKDILDNIKNIYMTDNMLENLMDFERVIDELDTYVFKNWLKGELIEGPKIEKYFVTCTFMWPYKLMPDPRGAERLLDYNCEVKYIKSHVEYPVTIDDPDDFRAGTKFPKMARKPVWLVEITIPKQLMREIYQGSVSLENDEIDLEDIQQSYEVGLDDEVYQKEQDMSSQGTENAKQPGQPGQLAAAPM